MGWVLRHGCSPPRARGLGSRGLALALCLAPWVVAGCGGASGGGSGQAGLVGEEQVAPQGQLFIVDPNHGGSASRLRVAEMFWGRLVDVHDIDANGEPSLEPLYRDFPISENISTDGFDYVLETNPITQQVRLIIKRQHDAPDDGSGTFLSLLKAASESLPAILPKNDDGTSPEPFSFMARNACLVVRFDDLLDDDVEAERKLPDTIHLLTGYPPTTPFSSRMIFDRHHGGIAGNEFHSTRVLIDMTVSEAESATLLTPQPLNSLGLPVSLTSSTRANVSVRIPTRIDFGSGVFDLLTNVSGSPLATTGNGPVDPSSPTADVVRAFRSGNPEDTNNGFLLDLNQPELLGGWPIQIETAADDPAGMPGRDFLADLRFATSCRTAPLEGDTVTIGNVLVEVSQPAAQPDAQGRVLDLRLRTLSSSSISASNLLGTGTYVTTYGTDKVASSACWITFTPQAVQFPSTGVSPNAQALIRFSEPMDPSTVSPFETFLLVRGPAGTQPKHNNIAVGRVSYAGDVREFVFTPELPLAHAQANDEYVFQLGGFKDLAGNGLVDAPSSIEFTIDPAAAPVRNGGVTLRFDSPDEVDPILGLFDLRGQFFYDLDRGIIKPRAVSFQSFPADRLNPVPSIMVPFPPGVQTPLSPLGSKLHSVWRYADLGWQALDETRYNVDVYGLNWAPVGGQVINDYYDEFEIRLAHSLRLPDECINQNSLLPQLPNSGLQSYPGLFTDNILVDPLSPQKTVHPRSLGYQVSQADLFIGLSGTLLMPFPLNRNTQQLTTYTWRDTAVLAKGGPGSRGIPQCIEVGPPLFLENGPGGVFAPAGQVPSFGLPLLMEYRCYPSNSGVGLNAFDVSLAINSSARPNFRSFSTGGINTAGTVITKNPDLEDQPFGGFNPNSSPPGKKTRNSADNTFYIGQVDLVIRVSRLHTIWLDTLSADPDYLTPIIEPSSALQPPGAQVIVDYRGAVGFSPDADLAPYDALQINAYGDITTGQVTFLNDVATWTGSIDDVDGARYVQLRISFINNISTGLNAELDAIGIPFDLP